MDANIETQPVRLAPRASETTLQLASANGEFYNSLLDVYLSKGNGEVKTHQLETAVNRLPPHARSLYKKGIQSFEAELVENHALLGQHRGEEIQYLVSCVMRSEEKPAEEITEVLDHITPDKAKFVEPIPGVAIIQVEKDLYAYLQKAGIVPGEAHAVNYASSTRDEPSFMILQRLTLQKGLHEEEASPAQDSSVRHEFHHFVWNFLKRAKFIREPLEVPQERSNAFASFRDELSAYIIEGRELLYIDPYAMVYTDNRQIQEVANNVKLLAYVCIQLAKKLGVDRSIFLYPTMTSRSFRDLKDKFLELVPLEEQVDVSALDAIYSIWTNRRSLSSSIQEVLEEKNSKISPELIREIALQHLSSPGRKSGGDFYILGDFRSVAESMEEFSKAMEAEGVAVANELMEVRLRGEFPFPDEVLKQVLNLPKELTENIPVVVDPEVLLTNYMSLWRIDQEGQFDVYSQLINSSPQMKAAFEKIKDHIIAEGEEGYKNEMGYERADEERKRKIDQELQRKVELFKSL